VLTVCRFYAGFEFAKKEYRQRYASDPHEKIPVWALLASGSFGGVSSESTPFADNLTSFPFRFLIGWLATHSML